MATEMLEKRKKYDSTLQEQVKKLLDSKKVDASTIARGIGKSPTTFSLYMQCNYKGNIEPIENELRKYLDFFSKKEKMETKSLNFVETSIVSKLFNAANMCQLKGKMGVCYGSPGIGKTTAILEYQKLKTCVIVVDPFEQSSTREVLQQIAD